VEDLVYRPAFYVYALFAVGLSTLLLALDGGGGVARAFSKTSPNPEDLTTVSKGAKLAEQDPETVARVMRAHRNALANVVPFLLLTLVYVLMGATAKHVLWVMSAFSAARLVHAIVYVRAKQPWRTLSFVVGQLCTGVVAVRIVIAAIHMLSYLGLEPKPHASSNDVAPRDAVVSRVDASPR
jgi:uncharacterized MAPEG superfamily protein